MSSLVRGLGSNQIRGVATSQDTIAWVEFLHGKVSVEVAKIQKIHCALSLHRMTGDNWMKHFIANLIQVLHFQWLYRNFTLHDQMRGYLCLQRRKEVLKEGDCLMDKNPEESHRAASTYWKWTSHPCIMPHLSNSSIGY